MPGINPSRRARIVLLGSIAAIAATALPVLAQPGPQPGTAPAFPENFPPLGQTPPGGITPPGTANSQVPGPSGTPAAPPAQAAPLPPLSGVTAVGEQVFRVRGPRNNLKIVERFSRVVELPSRIVRVDGFDPTVLNVTALTPRQIRMQAVAPGVTTLVLTDESGQLFEIEVFVDGDVRHLQAYIERMFPHASVQAVAVRDSVVLRGWVTQPEHITELVEIAETFYPRVLNQMKVGGVQQVALKVKVMEVQRSKIRRFGFNWLYLGEDVAFASTPGSLTPLASLSAPIGGPVSAGIAAASLSDPQVALGLVGDNSAFQGFLEALKKEGLLKIKAEPEIVTTNGRPATLLNGGEFPILVPQSLGTVTIEWREFGTRLEAVPIILGNGRLRLELAPEVSERDFANAVEVNGLPVPGLTTRRVNTQVEMKFGQTLMIAGLITSRKTADVNKIPLLGELPLIGAAFSRKRYDEVETELVVMVTPEFVGPLDPGEVPPGGPGLFTTVPTDRELYLDGMLEVPNYGGTDGGPAQMIPGGPAPGSLIGPAAPIPGPPPIGPRRGIPTGPAPSNRPPLPPADSGFNPAGPPVVPPPPGNNETPGSPSASVTPANHAEGFRRFARTASSPRPATQTGTYGKFPARGFESPQPGSSSTASNATVSGPGGLIQPKPGLIEPAAGTTSDKQTPSNPFDF